MGHEEGKKIGNGEICEYKARLNTGNKRMVSTIACGHVDNNIHTIHHQRKALPTTRFCIGISADQSGWRNIHEITQRFRDTRLQSIGCLCPKITKENLYWLKQGDVLMTSFN